MVLNILAFAFIFIPWGYALAVPEPNFYFGSGLLLIGVTLVAVAFAHAKEYGARGHLAMIVLATCLFIFGDYWLYRITQGPHIHIKLLAVADKLMGPTPLVNVAYENKGSLGTTVQPFYLAFFVNAPRSEADREALENHFASQLDEMFVVNRDNQFRAGKGDEGYFTTSRPQMELEELEWLHSGSYVLYYLGTIRYEVGGVPYETRFCIYLQGASNALFSCKTHREEHVPVRRR